MTSPIRVAELALPQGFQIPQLFQHFSDAPWAMLLDSANSPHSDGRYDIMVASPIVTLTTDGELTQIKHGNHSEHRHENPLQLLKQWHLKILGTSTENTDLPFTLGAVGTFSYDLGRRFEQLPSEALDDCQSPDMAVGIYSWSVVYDNINGKGYFCYRDDLPHPEQQWLEQLATQAVDKQPFALTQPWQANMDYADYQQKISTIHEYLKAGDCYQVNLAQRFSAEFSGNEWQAYKQLRKANSAPFSAFIRLPDSCIASISPERFLSVSNRAVQTKPIKGTRPRQQDPSLDQAMAEALQSSEKDRAENLMIVDLLRNDLSKSCQPGSVRVPELFAIESFPAVHHLVSTVTGELTENNDAIDLLQGCFPGGSITGAPKIRAMEIIDELEPHRRNIYCGSIGYIDISGNMDTSICIRTLLFEHQQVHCWAGGGIVIDSSSEDEYQESLDKVGKILPLLSEG